jgi:hypothetical protein
MSVQPTPEGLRRYPATQGHHADLSADGDIAVPDLDHPCTCTVACPPRCSGDCGCAACSLAFTIFADEAGLLGMLPMTPEQEAAAIARYQDV